jgi:CheY-like chemotaxis protein
MTTARGDPGDDYVLLVDDDEDIREAVELVLSAHGHRVAAVADGSAAFNWLTSGRRHPCVVLLDLMMPGMNGFELRSLMETEPSLAPIPVVVLTGAGVQADKRSQELKAPILRKPVSMATLLDTIERFCCSGRAEKAH